MPDEGPSLRIESFAIINLRGVSTKLYLNLIFTMQTYMEHFDSLYILNPAICIPKVCNLIQRSSNPIKRKNIHINSMHSGGNIYVILLTYRKHALHQKQVSLVPLPEPVFSLDWQSVFPRKLTFVCALAHHSSFHFFHCLLGVPLATEGKRIAGGET